MTAWNLNGCRAVVTGGSRGIGAALVDQLTAFGATVLSVSLEAGAVRENVVEMIADVATVEGRAAIVEAVAERLEGLEILVNNVGMNIRKPTVEYTFEEYEQVQRTNASSMFELSRLLHPALKASGRGVIVNVGSVAGGVSVGSSAAYAMSKAAVAQMSRYLAVEWAKDGIRVNAIAPGWVATDLTRAIQQSPAALGTIAARTPAGRMARPEEIAAVAAFACLPCASYLSGAVIPVDGGMSAFSMDVTAALREA